MTLQTLWFVLIAVLWGGFFVLEGFDFGVGMLHGRIGRDEPGRRAALSTIAPFWDGNEVWLVVAVAATFAAFPGWYATMFSGFYLLVVLAVVALILRGVALEFRERDPGARWQRTWDRLITGASLAIPLLLGVALGNLVSGVPVDSSQEFTGDVLDLLGAYPLLTGVTMVVLCVLLGATFLTLRTTGELRARSATLGRQVAPAAAALVLVLAGWTHHLAGHGWFPGAAGIVATVAVALAAVLPRGGREGLAFAAGAVGTGAVVATIFTELWPHVMVSSTNPAFDLTVSNTAAGSYSLKVMTVVAAVFLPLVLAYSAWIYVVLRRRIGAPRAEIPQPRQPQPSGDPAVRPRPTS